MSSIGYGGTRTFFNFMALLALSNAGVPGHFFTFYDFSSCV